MNERGIRDWAIVGGIWVGLLTIIGTTAVAVPLAWRMGYLEYGSICIVYLLGIRQGRDQDPSWVRRMRRAQWIGFTVAALLFAVGALLAT
jgi:hypothetical protein